MSAPYLDGCPECVTNTELPWHLEAIPGATHATYTCADCGHQWTTDWAVATRRLPRSEGVFGADSERVFGYSGGTNETAPGGAALTASRGPGPKPTYKESA